MIDRIMTEKIKHCVLNAGMDVVGFAPVSRWNEAPFLLSPQAILDGSQSVVVMGIYITDTWTEMGGEPTPHHVGPGGWMDQNSLLDRTGYKVVRLLESFGYRAIGIASSNIWRYRKYEGVNSWFTPDLSHIHAATAAGLAQIGWSGLAITPEYGPRVRFISVITEANLAPTPLYNGPVLCDMCGDCIKNCPTEALHRDFDGPPHVVRIEDKTFKYAYKNIWRCAWAEHFNLRLDSPTLKREHIDETDISREIETVGEYVHERGVCQKVCLPPHLRSGEPSFGRDHKRIAMLKIGRRYPDGMPTYKKLRDDLIARAVGYGAELAAAGPLDIESKFGQAVLRQAPGMKSVLAFAFQVPAEVFDLEQANSYQSAPYRYALHNKMHHLVLRIAKQLENEGYHAVAYTGEVPGQRDGSLRERLDAHVFQTDARKTHSDNPLIAMTLAESAGIGQIGAAFTTSEFGSQVMVGAVATSAVLDSLRPGTETTTRPPRKPRSSAVLKQTLWAQATENLVSLFGVASADAFDETATALKGIFREEDLGKTIIDDNVAAPYHGKWVSKIVDEDVRIRVPKDYLPEARSVIVLGMHIPQAIIDNVGLEHSRQIGTYGFYVYQTIFELYFAAVELCTYLGKLGYQTRITANMLGIGSRADSPRGLLPDFRCNALEAAAAGLGEIGINGGLITPEYGAQTRRIVIVTDAELPSDQPCPTGALFAQTNTAMDHCPNQCYRGTTVDLPLAGTTIRYPLIWRNRCDWAKKYSLTSAEGPALIGNMTHVDLPGDGEPTLEQIAQACTHKDEILKHRTVILEPCLRHCPRP
jgi:epoxyqueuosine reductase QueG